MTIKTQSCQERHWVGAKKHLRGDTDGRQQKMSGDGTTGG